MQCCIEKSKENCNVLPLHFAPSQASSSQNSNIDNFYLYCHNPFKILRTLPAIDCLDLMPWIPVWSWSWVGMSKNMFPVQWMYWWSVENMAEEDCFWLLSVALLINPNLWTEYIIVFQGMIVSVIILSDQKFIFQNSNLLNITHTHFNFSAATENWNSFITI